MAAADLKVFISKRVSQCGECGANLGRGAWIFLAGEKGALCLTCADLDHLIFLPSGDAALTVRTRKHSRLCAIVLRWSRARRRYERQGILVEESALRRAEEECLADAEVRERRRRREAERRKQLDQDYIENFAGAVRGLYPRCPSQTARRIAEHACLKYSGRVGRSAAAKMLDEEAVKLAVVAHVRHRHTRYDSLLVEGWDRIHARREVVPEIESTLDKWS